ncbi:MAG: hypothetical protein ACM3VT_07850 [Solirubrobacterales bacterium]
MSPIRASVWGGSISRRADAEGFNQTEFRRAIGQIMASRQDQSFRQINVGESLLEVSRNAANNGLLVPSELMLLGKTLLQLLDEAGKIFDPTFDASASKELQ